MSLLLLQAGGTDNLLLQDAASALLLQAGTTPLPHEDTGIRANVADIDGTTGSDGKVLWEKCVGTLYVSIASNEFVFPAENYVVYRDIGMDPTTVGYIVTLELSSVVGTNGAWVTARTQSNGYCYLFKGRDVASLLYRLDGSGFTLLGTYGAVASGDTIGIKVVGDQIYARINGVDETPVTDANITDGRGGLAGDAAAEAINFTVEAIPGAGTGGARLVGGGLVHGGRLLNSRLARGER